MCRPNLALRFTRTNIDGTRGKKEQEKKNGGRSLSLRQIVHGSWYACPSDDGVHAFSSEFASADSVAGAPGGTGAHMTIHAFGTPWTFFSYQTQTRSHQQNFSDVMQHGRRQPQEKNRHAKKKKQGLSPFIMAVHGLFFALVWIVS